MTCLAATILRDMPEIHIQVREGQTPDVCLVRFDEVGTVKKDRFGDGGCWVEGDDATRAVDSKQHARVSPAFDIPWTGR